MRLVVQAAREDASSGNHKPLRTCYFPSAVSSTDVCSSGRTELKQDKKKSCRSKIASKAPLKCTGQEGTSGH